MPNTCINLQVTGIRNHGVQFTKCKIMTFFLNWITKLQSNIAYPLHNLLEPRRFTLFSVHSMELVKIKIWKYSSINITFTKM